MKVDSDYLSPAWRQLLTDNGLGDFEALWQHAGDWFEAPNRRRGGWSGVSQVKLAHPDGRSRVLFLKRQQDHVYRDWRHPLRGRPTFARELDNLLAYRDAGIASLEPVYFGQRRRGRHQQALLMTVALEGFVSLDSLLAHWRSPRQRHAVIGVLAGLVRRIHSQGYWHGCLYPKHLLLLLDDDSVLDARVLDLEKSRVARRRRFGSGRDLSTLNGRALALSRSDRMRFLLSYLETPRLTAQGKRLWRSVEARSRTRFEQAAAFIQQRRPHSGTGR